MNKLKRKRDSNMELLRIISMLFILGMHANFLSIKAPYTITSANIANGFTRNFMEAICIVAVNVFVFISGWYGIKTSLKGLYKIVFQCIFIGCCILVAVCFYQQSFTSLTIDNILLRTDTLWFVYAYLGLYLLAPVLNTYISQTNKRDFGLLLIGFYILQTYIAWYKGFVSWYSDGYSTLSFIGIYLLARYLRIHPNSYTSLASKWHFAIYGICTVAISVIATLATYINKPGISSSMFSYLSPIVILSSVSLCLAFTSFKINSKLINWCAASCFSVYLTHCNPCVITYYTQYARHLYESEAGILYMFLIVIFITATFLISILLDQLRLFVWNLINK